MDLQAFEIKRFFPLAWILLGTRVTRLGGAIMLNVLCSAGLLLLAGQALAATTWTLNSTTPAGVTVTAVANTGGTDTSNNGQNQTIQAATLNSYSGGLGVRNADWNVGGADQDVNEGVNPEHAIDNEQRFDMVMLDFGASKVNLTSVDLGWTSTDSDITVMAYTGTNPVPLINKTYGALVGLGWTVIGNYSNVAPVNGTGTANLTATNAETLASGKYSSVWLIGAYNWVAAGGTLNQNTSAGYVDYVKLAAVTGDVKVSTQTRVPEPGSLALLSLALVALSYTSRRREA
jgi:hypothetical protein